MLKEVSQSILCRALLNGTNTGDKVELSTVCRFFIVLDIVCKTILQLAISYRWVVL
jgi:hypothetical protein